VHKKNITRELVRVSWIALKSMKIFKLYCKIVSRRQLSPNERNINNEIRPIREKEKEFSEKSFQEVSPRDIRSKFCACICSSPFGSRHYFDTLKHFHLSFILIYADSRIPAFLLKNRPRSRRFSPHDRMQDLPLHIFSLSFSVHLV